MFETLESLDIKPIFLAINGSLTSKKSGISTTCNVMGDFVKIEAHLIFVYKSKGLRLDVFLFVYKDTKLYSYQFML